MALYLPGLTGLLAVVITWAIGAVLLLTGSAVCDRGTAAEFRIGAGWGVICLVLTLWGVFLPVSLRAPAVAVVLMALGAQLVPARRVMYADGVAVGRLLLVSLPLWVVMAGVRPSQVDTFLNLLPNADYLVDYGRLPTAAFPPSYSFLPAAPYDTQFLSFLGALVWPDYPAAGMSLVNVMLRLIAGLAVARVLSRSSIAPSWSATALGMLLVTLFDPGFVPRFHFSAYGETALAVTALLAACLFVETRAGHAQWVGLSLILAAMVNTKQSGIGLVLAIAGAGVVVGIAECRAVWRPRIGKTVAALIPATLLYLVWRYFVAHAGVAELKMLPFSEWNWALIPTFESIAGSIAEKPLYFAAEVAALACLPLLLRRQGWTQATRYLAFNAAAFVLYNGFVLLTYVVHFSTEMAAEAHSYFRYNTHLSLILMLSLALTVRELAATEWVSAPLCRVMQVGVVVLALLAPVAFAERLRFDIEMPQPLVWNLAAELKPHLKDHDKLALLLPGDDGQIGDLLQSYLASAPPRLRGLDIEQRRSANEATLDAVATAGYDLAVISCTPDGLFALPASEAALVRHDAEGWHAVASWPYAAGIALSRWQHFRHWPALCR
jgi:hypothetical protein